MTSRERLVNALARRKTDVLPVTTHHIMNYYLNHYEGGITKEEFFAKYGFDAIYWYVSQLPNPDRGEYLDETQGERDFLEFQRIQSDNWQVRHESRTNRKGRTVTRFEMITPKKTLTMELEGDEITSFVTEYPIKEKSDIDILAEYLPHPIADVEGSIKAREKIGDRGIVRSHIPSAIDMFGQPGCWQDACCLFGTQDLIMETYDDPEWVHEFLRILQERKLSYVASLKGAAYDVLELGGGSGSASLVSPAVFEEYVAPYDKKVIEACHEVGQKIAYHLCGKKMALLDFLPDMGMDALETLTPVAMGGDVILSEVKKKLGDKMCLIGGFDQYTYFERGSEEETRKAVRRCFEEAGEGGGYILAPSDHFFDARPELVAAFADEAHKMRYQ